MNESSTGGAATSSAGQNPQEALRKLADAKKAMSQNDRWTALQSLRSAQKLDPANPEIGFNLSYVLDLVGEDDEALAVLEHACSLTQPTINAMVNLAVLYEDIGEYTKAEKCLKQVVETDPNHLRARLYLKDVQASKALAQKIEQSRTQQSAQASMLDTPLTEFELSVRARNCLKKMNIRTLGDLVRTPESELISYKNFGDTSLQEIRQLLSTRGLRLGETPDAGQNSARAMVYEQLRQEGKEELANTPVNDLNLSVRARNALEVLNIRTLADLIAHTEAELLGIKNFGQTSLDEIQAKLAARGLNLRSLD